MGVVISNMTEIESEIKSKTIWASLGMVLRCFAITPTCKRPENCILSKRRVAFQPSFGSFGRVNL